MFFPTPILFTRIGIRGCKLIDRVTGIISRNWRYITWVPVGLVLVFITIILMIAAHCTEWAFEKMQAFVEWIDWREKA